ncbi:hypothetical protein NUU61_006101 [Penicillium alfredii]|uniref:Uncharacterized protein n=1 Tax=Penicillium alfredii TaxID=1506179 RepID=A0A9W9K3F4_9EURO|nr:uncharacterized protein NUU61_006101 [Penicillium alfredii]KAJ5091231.1 hypothetical protein NUU61_006101 [Penicillium alfredii]
MHDRQITECSQIKNRYVNFSVVQSKILQNDQEVLDPYNATKIAKECGVICNPCRSFKNPESYAFYTMVR